MDQILYVLAIMGCSDDNIACQQQRVEPVRYSTHTACQQAIPAALNRNADMDYPVIAAACQQDGTQAANAGPIAKGDG